MSIKNQDLTFPLVTIVTQWTWIFNEVIVVSFRVTTTSTITTSNKHVTWVEVLTFSFGWVPVSGGKKNSDQYIDRGHLTIRMSSNLLSVFFTKASEWFASRWIKC